MNADKSKPFETELARLAERFAPPDWLVGEAQQRIVLLLNHIVMQEPQAMERLKRQKGRVIRVEWSMRFLVQQDFYLQLLVTPAGLFDLVPLHDTTARADLSLQLKESSPLKLLQSLLQQEKPSIHIAGDVQLAADINWLVDHVRWDGEEDLGRIVGVPAAHHLVKIAKQFAAGMKAFVARQSAATAGSETASSSAEGAAHASTEGR